MADQPENVQYTIEPRQMPMTKANERMGWKGSSEIECWRNGNEPGTGMFI